MFALPFADIKQMFWFVVFAKQITAAVHKADALLLPKWRRPGGWETGTVSG